MLERTRSLGWALLATLVGAVASGCSDEDPLAARGVAVVADSEDLRTYRQGRAWAVVVGIDDYRDAPRLNYAVADARAVGGELAKQGFDVTMLLDQEATSGAILGAIGDDLPKRVSPEDRVLIFFAGHGQTRKFEGGGEVGFLLPVEASLERLRQTAIDMGAIKSLADELPAKHVLFLIDACYGGIAGLRGRAVEGDGTKAYLRSITRDRGRQLITAGGPDEQAHESAEWGHSAFTHVLLKGLRDGLADLNEDGIMPASELHQYLERNVFDAVRHVQGGGRADAEVPVGKEQRPQFWQLAPDRGEFVFFVDSAPAAEGPALADAATPPAGEAEPADVAEAANGPVEADSLRSEMERLQQLQDELTGTLDQMNASAQGALAGIRTDAELADPAPTRPSLPPKTWTCTGNQVVVNGKKLTNMELVQLTLLAGGNAIEPGCYWYDAKSGMWGWEGQPAAGDMPVGLELGGPLRADASAGDTGVLVNGRELTQLELQRFGSLGGPTRPGHYWMNAQGVGGRDGASASFSIAAGVAAVQAAQAGQGQTDAGSGSNDSYYQSGDAHGGVQGDCVYMSGADFSYIGEGCD